MITIRKCKYGRGLFATETIPKGTIIEVSPYVKIPKRQMKALEKTVLWLYVYSIRKGVGMALGLGSLFNHADKPNVDYEINTKTKEIKYKTLKKVRKGSQLFVDYGYNPKDFDYMK